MVFAFLVLRDALVTTLHARRVPRTSLTSYTRAKPPCQTMSDRGYVHQTASGQTSPKNPTRWNSNSLFLSLMTLGGDGGVVLLFCLGNGGSTGAALTFSCLVGEGACGGGTWLIAFENGGRRCS